MAEMEVSRFQRSSFSKNVSQCGKDFDFLVNDSSPDRLTLFHFFFKMVMGCLPLDNGASASKLFGL